MFSANPVSGTASLSVPVYTSPGRSGFGPQLSLLYDSNAGNGPFGFGWSLSLPAITREPNSGLSNHQDTDEPDIYNLSGAEDLVPVGVEVCGQWQRESLPPRTLGGMNYEVQRYRPRIEGLFARIERWTDLQSGETHWRSISKDNVITLYGKTADSRIADPTDPTRIFSWLICESYDDKGNAILYEYVPEDSSGVDPSWPHERHRTDESRSANRYLKCIKYGNRAPKRPGDDLTQRTDWLFEVVFDYGEHDSDKPTPNDKGSWLCRHDPFSLYRVGFEVRTYRLCQRVLMFHHFPDEEEVGNNCLVRSTDLVYRSVRNNYEDLRKGHPGTSFVASITQSGYERKPDGSYRKKSLPPLELEYAQATVQEGIKEVDAKTLKNLPHNPEGTNLEWVDPDGEGLSNDFTEQVGDRFHKRRFGPLEVQHDGAEETARFTSVDSVAQRSSLAGTGQQVLDLAGEGQVDLFETGTAGVVWSSPQPNDSSRSVRYVDLMGGVKLHLLESIKNNLGTETKIRYAPSTRFYQGDAGRPWITKPPSPVHVVERVETWDRVTGTKLDTLYSYHHGYYDDKDQEFRGFGLVEQWDVETFNVIDDAGHFAETSTAVEEILHQPPAYTKTWYHTGTCLEGEKISRYEDEYFSGDGRVKPLPDSILPPGLPARERHEAYRTLKGQILRREIYAQDGSARSEHPYKVSERSYEIRRIQPMQDGLYAVFYAYPRESIDYHYERNPEDPRIAHQMTLELGEDSLGRTFGNVTKSAIINYPRRSPAFPEQEKECVTYAESDVVDKPDEAQWYRIGVPVESRTYEITGLSSSTPYTLDAVRKAVKNAREIPYEAIPVPDALQKRLIERSRSIYYKDDLSGALQLGQVEALALPSASYKMVFTPGLIARVYGGRVTSAMLQYAGGYIYWDGAWWLPSVRPEFDDASFYQPTAFVDPFGQRSTVSYDAYALLLTRTSDALGNTISARNQYRTMHPWRTIDPNGNHSAVRFDALGRVSAAVVMGKPGHNEGDKLDETSTEVSAADDPTTRFEYELFEWMDHRRPNYVHTLARERHGVANPCWQQSYSYSDGSGRKIMKKIQAGWAPGRGTDGESLRDAQGHLVQVDTSLHPRWVGTGRAVFDSKGNPIKKYQPFFSGTHLYEDEKDIWGRGVMPILRYDSLGRLVRSENPDGTFCKVELEPWRETAWDENDTVTQSRWHAERQTLPDTDPGRRASDLCAAHAGTPTVAHLDVLGRTFLTVDDNGPAGRYETYTEYDIQGNQRSVIDARGNRVLEQDFDMLGRRLHVRSADSGRTWNLPDVGGKVVCSWDDLGHEVRTTYDALRRPTHRFVRPVAGGEALVERTIYGEVHPDAVARNLRGRTYQIFDGAGVATNEEYDFAGNLTRSSRRLAREYRRAVDWSALAKLTDVWAIAGAAASLLEAGIFVERRSYDALNRLVSLTTPDDTQTRFSYHRANLLEKIDARLRGAKDWTAFVKGIDHNAKGQRERIEYGNGVCTEYAYDPSTSRLTNLRTIRSDGSRLQDLGLTHDPVGNITEIRDGAEQEIFFDSAVVPSDTRYEYDALYRLTRADGREHVRQAAIQSASAQVNRDEPPRTSRSLTTDGGAMRRYTERYGYDAVGNILRTVHRAPGGDWTRRYEYAETNNRLLGTSRAHDAPRDVVRVPRPTKIRWNPAEGMRRADLGDGGVAYYAYDAVGQRVRKVVERPGCSAEEQIYLGCYGLSRRLEGCVPRVERETVHVMEDGRRVALVETRTDDADAQAPPTAPLTRYQLDNHLGSVVLELDENGEAITYEEYYPFGGTSYQAAGHGAGTSAKRYRFTGKERDEESGLYYHGARYYAPWLARWISADPAGMVDGTNPYQYVRSNPTKFRDPSGMWCEAGHYYTVYVVALAAGFSSATAFKTAFYAQMPDEVEELDAAAAGFRWAQSEGGRALRMWWNNNLLFTKHTPLELIPVVPYFPPDYEKLAAAMYRVQLGGHALTALTKEKERAFRSAELSSRKPGTPAHGLAAHAFGDSYGHTQLNNNGRMYGPGLGHGVDCLTYGCIAADQIRPHGIALYDLYVRDLLRVFAKQVNPKASDTGIITEGKRQTLVNNIWQAALKDRAIFESNAAHSPVLTEETEYWQILAFRDFAKVGLKQPLLDYAPEKSGLRTWEQFYPARGNPEDLQLQKPGYKLENFLTLYLEWEGKVEADPEFDKLHKEWWDQVGIVP